MISSIEVLDLTKIEFNGEHSTDKVVLDTSYIKQAYVKIEIKSIHLNFFQQINRSYNIKKTFSITMEKFEPTYTDKFT